MKALHVFDFDDTLIKSDSEVVITKKDGTVLSLNSTDYKHYKKEPGDEFDYSDFNEYPKNAEFIDTVFAELKAAIALDGIDSVVILTARANPRPVEDFLSNHDLGGVKVVGTGSDDPWLVPTIPIQCTLIGGGTSWRELGCSRVAAPSAPRETTSAM